MSNDPIIFTIDGREVTATPGQTILEAADAAGIHIPRLCYLEGLTPQGSCRLCIVKVNGRLDTSCTLPVINGMAVESNTEEISQLVQQLRGDRQDAHPESDDEPHPCVPHPQMATANQVEDDEQCDDPGDQRGQLGARHRATSRGRR